MPGMKIGAPEGASLHLRSRDSTQQQQQQQQEEKQHQLERGTSKGSPQPKRRLISRAELLRHSSCSLLKMLSSSSLLGSPPEGFEDCSQQMQQEGILLFYITGWEQPHLHHRVAGGLWTETPGDRMAKVDPRVTQGKALLGLLPKYLRGYSRD
ncbi:hypothetical protein Efla_006760 [Eimeria flavescens]